MTWPTVNPLVSWDDGIRWHVDEVTAPTIWPLDAQFVLEHLRLTATTPDVEYVDQLIRTATRQAERFTKRAIAVQTLAMKLSAFPSGHIQIAMPPLIEVESVTYVDESGDAPAFTDYQVDAPHGPTSRRGRIAPAEGASWPSTSSDALSAVTVTYRAGYVDGGSPEQADVPEDLAHGILLVIGELYKQRSESVIGIATNVTPAVVRARDLWLPYRIW